MLARSRRVKMPTLSASIRRCASSFLPYGLRGEWPPQAYTEGESVRVGPRVARTLQQVAVQRGEPVTAGAALTFVLERENEIAARRQAEEWGATVYRRRPLAY